MDAALTLAGMNLRWSKMVKCVTTFKAARMVLNDGMAKVEELHHHGALGETEKEKLMVLMKEQVRSVTVHNGLQRSATRRDAL